MLINICFSIFVSRKYVTFLCMDNVVILVAISAKYMYVTALGSSAAFDVM